jgi:hypothetical protein
MSNTDITVIVVGLILFLDAMLIYWVETHKKGGVK